jgi:hypothetical protein
MDISHRDDRTMPIAPEMRLIEVPEKHVAVTMLIGIHKATSVKLRK